MASSSSENRLRGLPCTVGRLLLLLFKDFGESGGDTKFPRVVAGLRISETILSEKSLS